MNLLLEIDAFLDYFTYISRFLVFMRKTHQILIELDKIIKFDKLLILPQCSTQQITFKLPAFFKGEVLVSYGFQQVCANTSK